MPRLKTVRGNSSPAKGQLRVIAPGSQMDSLAVELYSLAFRALTLYGMPLARQVALFNKTRRNSKKTHSVSGSLLEQFLSLSDLLSMWLQELPYVDATGHPKILPIRGRGATFESLARQFLPKHSIEEAVELACHSATVGVRPGGKIAVYGDSMVNVVNNPELMLAQTISHITNIIRTAEVNQNAARRDTKEGRLERLVYGRLSRSQFEVFKKAIRPQLSALCEQADRILKNARTRKTRDSRKTYPAGIGLYLYLKDQSVRDEKRSSPRAKQTR